MILCWWDVMRTRWWLHSTTGSYRRPVLEAAYGETIIHSTEAIWEILTREEWLGCWHDTSPMVDIPGRVNTSVGALYGIFWFYNIKAYMYYILKIYSIMKRKALVVSDIILARRCSENVFDHLCYIFLNLKWKSTDLVLTYSSNWFHA